MENNQWLKEYYDLRAEYLQYIVLAFIVSIVFTLAKLLEFSVLFFKKKKHKKALEIEQQVAIENRIKAQQELLSKLQSLYAKDEVAKKFNSKDSCIKWGTKVAPLLKYNDDYYTAFMQNLDLIPRPLSAQTIAPAIDSMIGLVKLAIEDIKNEITTTQPLTSPDTRSPSIL